ncbi:D-isomer specific 2-hydroxyacid dehydrogenase [Xylariales sp. AK1849]|nr:D-isomer specific 2-hydroxyacid dehydrogenase [Xylariales sp. AK1849]
MDAHHNVAYTAHNPQGDVLGVVGLGNIGYRIATKAYKAFDMRIIYHDPKRLPFEAHRYADLNELLAEAKCVVLAAPGGRKILDKEANSKLKKGTRVVNVARGSLIGDELLADALEKGDISAVGLDVYEQESRPDARLAKNRNATLTCQTAGGALETRVGFERLPMENVQAVLTGQAPLTPVNKHSMK